MHAFDGRTDGQTDRNLIARPRLHSMQRGKNLIVTWHTKIVTKLLQKSHCSRVKHVILSTVILPGTIQNDEDVQKCF